MKDKILTHLYNTMIGAAMTAAVAISVTIAVSGPLVVLSWTSKVICTSVK